MLKSMLITAGLRFFTGTRLSTLFGLSLRDPSRVRGVRTLAGASWEIGLPLELEIVELSDGFLIEYCLCSSSFKHSVNQPNCNQPREVKGSAT